MRKTTQDEFNKRWEKLIKRENLFRVSCYKLKKKYVVVGKLSKKEFDSIEDAKKYIRKILEV